MFTGFGDDFAEAIMTLLYAYDPEILVLGGSMIKAYPCFEKRVREKLHGFDFQNSLKKAGHRPNPKAQHRRTRCCCALSRQ
jgi:glucokinase